jgi:hypothetical protein
MPMTSWFTQRYREVLASIYIYNEHRGYTAIDRVIAAVQAHFPDDRTLLDKLRKHRADERKHYVMFRRWFERRGVMPLEVDRTFGHIDRFIELMFGVPIDRLDNAKIATRTSDFARLCRIISLTEQRGYRQVESLLNNPIVRGDPVLTRIFEVIRHDEPSHWAPYDEWLTAHESAPPRWWTRLVDSFIHAELILVKLPVLFLNPWAKRRRSWPDDRDADSAVTGGRPAIEAAG